MLMLTLTDKVSFPVSHQKENKCTSVNLTGHRDTVGIHRKRQLAVHLQTIQNMNCGGCGGLEGLGG